MEVRTHLAVDTFGDVDFPIFGPAVAVGPYARPVRDLTWVPGHRGQPRPRFDEPVPEAELTLGAHQATGIDGIADAAVLALADQGQVKRPAALADLGGIVAVLFRGIDRGGDARAVPAGRPLGRVQAGAVELIVERQLPVAADTGRHQCLPCRRCLFPREWSVRRRWLRGGGRYDRPPCKPVRRGR